MQPPLLNGDWKNTSLGTFVNVEEGHFNDKGDTWRNAAATATR